MEVVLEDNVLKEFVDQEILKLEMSDAQNLFKWKVVCGKGEVDNP